MKAYVDSMMNEIRCIMQTAMGHRFAEEVYAQQTVEHAESKDFFQNTNYYKSVEAKKLRKVIEGLKQWHQAHDGLPSSLKMQICKERGVILELKEIISKLNKDVTGEFVSAEGVT